MPLPKFKRICVATVENDVGPAPMNTFFNIGDVNGDGRMDVILSGRDGDMVWIQNNGTAGSWPVHLIDHIEAMECGGLLHSLTGEIALDAINGGDWRGNCLQWWQNPGDSTQTWFRRLIHQSEFGQFHDTLIGDITGDGHKHLIFTNQGHGSVGIVPIPSDPCVEPWPNVQLLATEMREKGQADEGLALLDVDGDGVDEIIFGVHWFKHSAGNWTIHRYAIDYVTTVLEVADVDGDGKPELLVSEGDPVVYGLAPGGKLAWFKPGPDPTAMWDEHIIENSLLDGHSLQAADLCGNGRMDIVVGEIGDRDKLETSPPRLFVYENLGDGQFRRHIIDEGTGTHHARLADFRGTGRFDIVSKPLHGPEKWHVFVWFNEGFA